MSIAADGESLGSRNLRAFRLSIPDGRGFVMALRTGIAVSDSSTTCVSTVVTLRIILLRLNFVSDELEARIALRPAVQLGAILRTDDSTRGD